MPVERTQDNDPVPNRGDLVAALVQEWRQPAEAADESLPTIRVHEGGRVFGMLGKPLHIEVVWAAWQGLEQVDRTAIIMDAFQQVYEQPEDILRVTMVRGLTRAEDSSRQGTQTRFGE